MTCKSFTYISVRRLRRCDTLIAGVGLGVFTRDTSVWVIRRQNAVGDVHFAVIPPATGKKIYYLKNSNKFFTFIYDSMLTTNIKVNLYLLNERKLTHLKNFTE